MITSPAQGQPELDRIRVGLLGARMSLDTHSLGKGNGPDLLYHATASAGAWCGDRRLQVSTVTDPAQALIGTGWPFKRPALLPRFMEHFATILTKTAGIRRAGAASLDFIDVAQGRFDGFWEPYLAPWDVAAGSLIVREAGGIVSDYAGNPAVIRHGEFVTGNPAIHVWLLETLAEKRPLG